MLIVPSRNSWNDFGFQLHADIGIRNLFLGTFEWVQGFFVVKGHSALISFVSAAIGRTNAEWVSVDRLRDPFASMLRNIKAYQELIRQLDVEGAERVAIAARDVAFAHARGQPVEGWVDFESSAEFSRAFMRISEATFAYENAGRVFSGQSLDAEDARQNFVARIPLEKALLTYQFHFPDDEITENRIAVIIGRNGTGKTASLIALARALLDRGAKGVTVAPRPLFNQLLVFAHSKSLKRFAASSRTSKRASLQVFELDPTRDSASSINLTTQLISMMRESDHLDNPLQALIDITEAEFHGVSIWVPVFDDAGGDVVSIGGGHYASLKSFRFGGEQARLDRISKVDAKRPLVFLGADKAPRKLSLGQDAFISFAFHAIGKSGPASVFLVDEPENFLHPNLISRFVRLLHSVLSRTKSIGIVATHSPYIVREVQSTQVHVLGPTEDQAEAIVQNPRLQTFGANVGVISDHIFGDDLVEHLHVRLLRAAEEGGKPIQELLEDLKEKISLDALMLLRQQREDKENDGASSNSPDN